MRTEIKTITPEHAKLLISKNLLNRNIQNRRVLFYADEMKNNRWKLNGESIKISKSGMLLDGQHRLLGCISADTSFITLVVTDVEDSYMPTIDTGKPRTNSDVFKISGVPNSTNISSGISFYFMLIDIHNKTASFNSVNVEKQSSTKCLLYYNDNVDLVNYYYSKSASFYHSSYRTIKNSEYLGLSLFLKERLDYDLTDFFNDYLNRVGVLGLLYDKLLNNNISNKKLSRYIRVNLILKAIKHYINDTNVKILKWSNEEPQVFLV